MSFERGLGEEEGYTVSNRIHILGVGSIGSLVAHALASLPSTLRPPVTLLMHRPSLKDDFILRKNAICLSRSYAGEQKPDRQTSFDAEVVHVGSAEENVFPGPSTQREARPLNESDTISSLVLAVKGAATVKSIKSIKHRFQGPRSTILFLQNGMGQLEELNEQVFPDPTTRPQYLQGIISHGAYLTESFNVVHAGNGAIQIGMVESSVPSSSNLSCRLVVALLSSPSLNVHLRSSSEILTIQLLKLAVNAINNPLTALLDIPNGHQLSNPVISSSILPTLIAEISKIILSLPEILAAPKETRERFTTKALDRHARDIIDVNRKNSSSMREDMRKERETEIKYINGYLVRRGKETGVDVSLNELLLRLVEAKTLQIQGKVAS